MQVDDPNQDLMNQMKKKRRITKWTGRVPLFVSLGRGACIPIIACLVMLKEPPGRETEGQGADSHLLRLTTQGEAQNIPLTTIRVNRTENPPDGRPTLRHLLCLMISLRIFKSQPP